MEDPQKKAQDILDKMPEEARKRLQIGNDGQITANNRTNRRRKPPTDNQYTKPTRKKRVNRKKTYGQQKHNR